MQVGDSAPIISPEPSGVTPDTVLNRLAHLQDDAADLADRFAALAYSWDERALVDIAARLFRIVHEVHEAQESYYRGRRP